MQNFYKKALSALVLLLVADALIACLCVYQSYPSAALMPSGARGLYWRTVTKTDAPEGGTSTIRVIESGQRSLRFDFRLTRATQYPFVSADMLFEDASGEYAWTDVFIRRNGAWQVIASHTSRLE